LLQHVQETQEDNPLVLLKIVRTANHVL